MMKYLKLTLLFALLSLYANGQNPGNLGTTNITAWFTPESLPNGDVQSWTTTYPSGGSAITVTDNSAPYIFATETPANNISNYNRTLELLNNDVTTLKALENTNSSLGLIENGASGDEGTFFCAYYLPTTTSNDHMIIYNSTTKDGIQLRNLGTKGRIAIGANTYTSSSASRDWNETFKPSIVSYQGNRSSYNSMTAFNDGAKFTGGVASQSSGIDGLYIGYRPATNNSAYNGYLHEFLFYDRDLSSTEITKVNTYLAIKYGVTLNADAGGTNGDYMSANGNVVWDASDNSAYHNDVVGLAREDSQGLLQKQSHSFDDTTRIYIGTLEASNNSNGTSIANNESFLMIGHNANPVCGNLNSIQETPFGSSIQSRVAREWKITNTNFSNNFNLDIKLNNCISPTSNDISNIKILIDDDGDFTNAQIYSSADLGISLVNGLLTISDITTAILPENTTRYLTIAYTGPSIVASFDATNICQGDSVKMTFDVINGSNIDLEYSDGSNNYQLTNISNGDFIYLHPTSVTTYFLITSTPFLNCCAVGSNNNPTTITVYNLPNIEANATRDTICYGEETTLYGSGGASYSWSDQITNNVAFTSYSSQTYTVEGTDANGCVNLDEIMIEVAPETSIDLGSDTSICPQAALDLSLNQTFDSYLWDNGSTEESISIDYQGSIKLVVTDEYGCEYSDSIFISLSDRCSDLLFVPNVFTPNGDGENDLFFAYGSGISDLAINIFNRWGNLVYTSEDLNFSWDGKNQNGSPCNEGVYIYSISYSYDGFNREEAVGHVTIIR